MIDLRPSQIVDLQRKIDQWKRRAKSCAVAGNNSDKEIIDRRIEGMEIELSELQERTIEGGQYDQ